MRGRRCKFQNFLGNLECLSLIPFAKIGVELSFKVQILDVIIPIINAIKQDHQIVHVLPENISSVDS